MDETTHHNVAEAPRGLLLHIAQNWLNAGLDLIFPPRCAGCGRVDMLFCPRCQAEIDRISFIPHLVTLLPLTASAATGVHEGKLRETVHALKYQNTPALSQPLGKRLALCLRQLGWNVDIITPVPLHANRLRERGYNQAQVLGEVVAAEHQIPIVPEAITRWRFTGSQVGLNSQQRRTNVDGAFAASPALVEKRTLLLIDDVFTTGATLQACAQAALDQGAAAVYSLTITAALV